MTDLDLKNTDYYLNRELSLLAFNERVLAQAAADDVPLLERLRYLCISCTNLDEFFEVRVAGVKQRMAVSKLAVTPDGLTPADNMKAISAFAHTLVDRQYRMLNETLIPRLAEEQIRFIRRSDFTPRQEQWVHDYFMEELLPILTPIGLDPAHPFPRLINKSLTFIVSLKGKDAFGRSIRYAVVQAPRALPRVIQLPPEHPGNGRNDYVFLSSIMHSYVSELFPGLEVIGCYQFRVTRNSDLFVHEEEIDDLLRALEGELTQRRFGDAVRLEVSHDCPDDLVKFLRDEFQLREQDVYQVNGPVNLNRLSAVCDIVDRPDLKFSPFSASVPRALEDAANIFNVIAKRDVLLHHPFQSFRPVIGLLSQAAADPNVLAIKQTLYRCGPDSAVVDALVTAAESGKEVTVVIELRARFDEAENIALANKLQKAGAHVVYGIVGYKTHAKMFLLLRREGAKIVRYAHLGTGNYHANKARLYTDYGLLTANKAICKDVQNVFMQLTGPGQKPALKKILQSPFSLGDAIRKNIEREEANARAGKPAKIIAKMNALTEPNIIRALYRAAAVGVEIKLIVRGICALRSGVAGVSDNIEVRSIVGRFLEHTRVFYFHNDGAGQVYCASADWMERNLSRRVETAFPIDSGKLRERILDELELYLNDNTQAWLLQADGSYIPAAAGAEPRSAQRELLERFAA